MLDEQNPIPLYFQLKMELEKQIETGVYKPDDLIPPELELCDQYKISRNTARQALALMVEEGVLVRVRGKGTFVRKANNESAATPKSDGLLGVVLPYKEDFYTGLILRGIQGAVANKGWRSVLAFTNGNSEAEEAEMERLVQNGASALLVMPVQDKAFSAVANRLRLKGFPIVALDRTYEMVNLCAVVSDNMGGAFLAVQHLIGLGRERVAMVTHSLPNTSSIKDRILGYRAALTNSGLIDDSNLICHYDAPPATDGDVKRYWVERHNVSPVLQRFVLNLSLPSAVFAVNDFAAIDVMRVCIMEGIRVPADLAIVGFDDLEFAQHLIVPLTTVAQNPAEIGKEAAELAFDLANQPRQYLRQIVIPTQLVVRTSSGVVPEMKIVGEYLERNK